MEGWIKIHRKILENPIICKDCETFSIWLYLLLSATHQEIPAIFKGEKIILKKGQLITGILSISKKLKINKDKIQRTLKCFENDKQIEQQTSNKNRLITILNWEQYQNNNKQIDKQVINKCETDDKQLITNKNVKNDKNVKNGRNNISASEETSSADTAKANSKHKYGEYGNVLLKDEELQKLKEEYENWEELIKYLDEYIEMKGYKAKSHYLCIKKWVVDAVKKQNLKINKSGTKEEKPDGADIWLKKMKEKEKQNNAI